MYHPVFRGNPFIVIYIFSVHKLKRVICRASEFNTHQIVYIIDDNEMHDQSIPTSTNSMLEMQKHYSRVTSTSLNTSADVLHSLTFALNVNQKAFLYCLMINDIDRYTMLYNKFINLIFVFQLF